MTESQANDIIANDVINNGSNNVWYNNSHGVLDEFIHKCSLKPCVGCRDGKSAQVFDQGPICRKCRSSNRHEGTTVRTPKVLMISSIGRPLQHRVFTKPNHIVDEEYVTFLRPEDIPFLTGDEELDEKSIKAFLSTAIKTAVYDIETVPVDRNMEKIPDEIISIQITMTKGHSMTNLALLTRKLPTCWEMPGVKRTEEFLSTVLTDQEEIVKLRDSPNTPLPDTSVLYYKSERNMLEGFRDLLTGYKAHLLVSFNGRAFDDKFILRSSVASGIASLFRMLATLNRSEICH